MISLFISLKHVLSVGFLLSSGSCLQESLVKVTEHSHRNGNIIQRKQTTSELTCALLCLRKDGCLSFNYKAKEQCELLSDTAEQFVDGLSKRAGWIYGEIVTSLQWNKNGPPLQVTFTTLGAKGRTGPQDTKGYQGTPLEGKVTLDKGTQIWIVPTTGRYSITACGASGGNGKKKGNVEFTEGGKGAKIRGVFKLDAGEKLKILVGQQGISKPVHQSIPGGGGGGTFVIKGHDTPMVVAGGGGGGAAFESGNTSLKGDNGQKTENGTRYGGYSGRGGRRSVSSLEASGGGGYRGNGEESATCTGGSSFLKGGAGGESKPGISDGGFGGGGAGTAFPGGGGGYSGGGVEKLSNGLTVAGGGGSYNRGAEQENSEGVRNGDGEVMVKMIG
ncbi:ALK tyrosine kinase receptor-like [Acropora millepora]|uniref:ALK tyrosine kinase receptor-like n=1 Tax=Acropora millepora TaxID=45264 RepID=UPI001CF23289|nr:ALK tyrosine kinase receptor-like [Acropora millepora]XP_044174151.1 ALK tyrosine kinase receptor-like [Acropora millepora]